MADRSGPDQSNDPSFGDRRDAVVSQITGGLLSDESANRDTGEHSSIYVSSPTIDPYEAHDEELYPPEGRHLGLVASAKEIPAKLCSLGHENNTDSVVCRICGTELGHAAEVVSRIPAVLACLLFEDGTKIDVVNDLLIGRNPIEADGSCDTLTVSGTQVSRKHLLLEINNWQILVNDCDSTNGTFIAKEGERGRMRVKPNDPVALHVGDCIHFGSRRALVVESTN